MNHNEMIEVIAAHRDGKALQCWSHAGQTWVNWEHSEADQLRRSMGATKFRVKPEPRRGFVADVFAYETRAVAEKLFPQAEIIEFVEVVK